MKKTISLALLLAGYALAQDVCVNNVGSGCGQWWMNSSTQVDGTYNHSTGVSTAYTANYTNVNASQDPLNAIFSWTNNTSNNSSSAVTTNNFINVWGSQSNPTSSTTNNAASGLYIGASDYSGYNNISSYVPSNTGGSTPIMGGSTATSSYESYLAMIYGLSYGTGATGPNVPSVVIPNADPTVPEPASILSMGLGLAGLAAMAYRRRSRNAAK